MHASEKHFADANPYAHSEKREARTYNLCGCAYTSVYIYIYIYIYIYALCKRTYMCTRMVMSQHTKTYKYTYNAQTEIREARHERGHGVYADAAGAAWRAAAED